jgi:hypothetical protein
MMAFVACKKEYTCDCKTTVTSSNSIEYAKNDSKSYGAKMTKKQAQSACEHEETGLETSYTDVFKNLGATGYTFKSDCALK